MDFNQERLPAGPKEKYKITEDLLEWMGRQFNEFGDIYKASIYGASAYVTRDIEFAHHVLVENWQNYVKGLTIKRVALLLGNGLMVSEGQLWKRQRKMIQPAFQHKSVGPLTKMFAAVNAKLLDKWQLAARSNESVNVTHDVSSMALEVVLRFIFGEDYDRVGFHFDLLSDEKVRNLDFASSFRALGDVILQVVDQRRKEKRDLAASHDALSMLMQARDPDSGQSMPDRQLINEVLTIIVAGHETTASTLNWTWYLISQHPEVEQRLTNELKSLPVFSEFETLPKYVYTRHIIEEALRLYPAGWMVSRRALRDDRLGAYFVPAKTEIYIPIYFIHRHPNLWEEPDRFNPDRFNSDRFRPELAKQWHRLTSIPFSAGPRNCIGELFARTEMQIHLLTIARHLRLRYIQTGPVEFEAGVNLRSREDFHMYPEAKVVGNPGAAPSQLDPHAPGEAFG